MPEVEKLFDMIQSNPPDNVEELKGMLADTGYGEAPEGVAGLMEEEVAVEETPEGEEVEAEVGAEGEPRSLDDILGGMMGPKGEEGEEGGESDAPASPMDAGKGGDVKGMSISVMRGRAAKNAMNKMKKS